MNEQYNRMIARVKRIASTHKELRLEVLRAVCSLSILSGFNPYHTQANLQMGDLTFALKVKTMYAEGVLEQARLMLDSQQGLEPQDGCHPITPSFEYGLMKREWLKRTSLMGFNLKGTQSGRLSSDKPNQSNPPKE